MCRLVVACLGTVSASGIKDNANAAGAPRLYRNAPLGIYASAAPHGAFTFQVPSIALKPTQLIPVNQESLVIEKSNGYLKDSYGNRFLAPSQSVAYKTTFPQQFVQLQHLPDHLAQPLSATPSYHFPQGPPQAFFSSQYRLPSVDAVTSPLTRYGVTHPFAYAGGVKSLTPASDQQFQFVSPVAQQAANSNNQVIYGTQSYSPAHNEQKFQRLEEKPAAHHHNENLEAPRQPQVAQSIKSQVQTPVRHTVKTTHNGKDTVVQIETKPPLPLLDLSLLEPLTFANPIVPQVQHYLPKINAVTYKELHPADVDEVKKHNNEFVVQKTKSYDSGIIKGKPQSDAPKKKQKTPPKKDTTVHVHYEKKSEKPSIKVKGKPNDAEYSYEIQSPNYKETYNEQVVSYNKETKNDPITYTYQKETQKEPVTYSFSHSSKDPGQTQKVQYVKKDPVSNHLVYQFQPAEQNVKHNDGHHSSPEPESDDSGESDSDDEAPSYDHAHYDTHHDKPSHSHQATPSHSHHSHPSTPSQHSHKPTHSHSSQSHHPSTHSHNPAHSHSSQSHHPSTHSHSHSSSQSHHPSTQSHDPTHSHSASQSHHPTTHSHSSGHAHPSPHPSTSQSHHSTPHSHSADHVHPSPHPHYATGHPATHSHQSQPQHSNDEQQSHNPQQAYYTVTQKSPQYYNHPELTPLHEFMENLRFIPSYTNAAIRVDPNQHVQKQPGSPQYYIQQKTPGARSEAQLTSEPVIYEKSKKIIIQEESPDEVHSHQEKLTAQMVGKEENNEEDFEKSYKEAAYGFPAYDRDSRESEDDIYNPESYGEPQNSEEDTGKHFEEYQEEGDEFPKFARLGYKDSRDKTKESYFQDYSIQKPESMTDRYQSKINYYKMFLKHKPEKLRHSGNSDKNKELAKYTVAPSFFDSAPKQKSKQSAAYKAAPTFEYDYLKDSRDSSAHASRPSLRFKSRTHFVEPQFQYGFEPIAIPRLDSELDTMASNLSPESEKPGTRKKVYKENWYIKKTSTSSKPS